MDLNETITVAIKKSDADFLRTYIHGVDSTIQSLCASVLTKELNSKILSPEKKKNEKITIGKISLASTEGKIEALKILTGSR